MGFRTVLVLAAAAASILVLSGCDKRLKAPAEAGVCYFIGHPKSGVPKFNVIARNVPDLEHCAVYVYNVRMDMLRTGTAGKETQGSFNGNFLFADNREVRFAQHYESPTFPLLVKAPDGRLVTPGSIVQDDDAPSGPITVNVPKNLPTKP